MSSSSSSSSSISSFISSSSSSSSFSFGEAEEEEGPKAGGDEGEVLEAVGGNCCEEVGGWVGGLSRGEKAVRMSYCMYRKVEEEEGV